jgi:hypothetical protein
VASLEHRHVPPYLIDRLLAGVLPAEVAGAVERQEQGCDLCSGRIDDARRDLDVFLARHPPERRARELLWRRDRGQRRRRIAWAVPALSVVGFALFAVSRAPLVETAARRTLAAAEPSVRFSVFRPGSPGPRPGRSGEHLRAGDVVQLHLDAGRFRGAHVFSLDGEGRAEALYDWSPASGSDPPPFVLDDGREAEQIVVLFHELPDPAIELPRLREAMARTYPGPGAAAVPPPRPADGREVVTGSILLRKEGPPDAGEPPDLSRTL